MAQLLLNQYAKVFYLDNDTYADYSSSVRNWTANTMVTPLTVDEDFGTVDLLPLI